MDHVYQEAGLIMDNALRYKCANLFYIRLGIGGFYRLGYYRLERPEDNWALKLSVNLAF